MAAGRTARDERRAIHPLPLSEMLLGERSVLRHRLWLGKTRLPDRLRGLVRAHQIARIPDRIARQDFCHRQKHLTVAGVTGDVALAIDVAAVVAHWRMPHPPPSRDDDLRFVFVGHRKY